MVVEVMGARANSIHDELSIDRWNELGFAGLPRALTLHLSPARCPLAKLAAFSLSVALALEHRE
jgi:hypothetical protein